MAADRSVEMAPDEIHAFLGRGGTGVLSLAAGNVPYATPVSYGFDPDGPSFYFRLGSDEDSEKPAFIESSETARFVVFGRTDDRWRSVIAAGPLDRIDASALTADIASALRQADLPLFGIWEAPRDALEFEIYRLAPAELTGRTAASPATDRSG